jgi:hypothetical protein
VSIAIGQSGVEHTDEWNSSMKMMPLGTCLDVEAPNVARLGSVGYTGKANLEATEP